MKARQLEKDGEMLEREIFYFVQDKDAEGLHFYLFIFFLFLEAVSFYRFGFIRTMTVAQCVN